MEGNSQWHSVAFDAAAAEALAEELDLPPAVAGVLAGRGYANAELAAPFLAPRLSDLADPFTLPGMRRAVDRVWAAIEGGETICVFGDYDADGVSAAALLAQVLGRLGARVETFLPRRVPEGYGFTGAALERCLAAHRPSLIVTVDCGTCAHEAVRQARERGIDTVVTDHHEATGAPAEAVAVVNPKLGDSGAAQPLAGVGVAFRLCHGLVKRGLDAGRRAVRTLDLREYLDLVALGTVADVAPLVGENRTLVRHGLQRLAETSRAGLRALIDAAGLQSARGAGKSLTSYHVGFVLGPRLNAAGRLGEAGPALELLMTGDAALAGRLARELDRQNSERRGIEEQICREAGAWLQARFDPARDFGLVAANDGWHVGTIGIVAARLVARFGRPVVLVGFDGNGRGRGSGRSIEGFDLVGALRECDSALVSYGGHAAAAGLVVERCDWEDFRERFKRVCADRLAGRDLRPVQPVDGWIPLGAIDDELLQAMERLGPFGMGHPTPVWGCREVAVVGRPRLVGRNHLRLVLADGGRQMDAIGFGMGDRQVPSGPLDVLFQIRENRYAGARRLQLHLKDFRAAKMPCAGERE